MKTMVLLAGCASASFGHSLSLDIGPSFPLTSIDITNVGGGKETAGTTGLAIGGQFLYDLRKDIGLGLDINHYGTGDRTSSSFIPAADSTLNSSVTSVLAVWKFSMLTDGKVWPYIIGGLGMASANLKVDAKPSAGFVWRDSGTNETRSLVDKTNTAFSGAVALGLDVPITSQIFLGAEARYTFVASATYDTTPRTFVNTGVSSVQGTQAFIATTAHLAYKF